MVLAAVIKNLGVYDYIARIRRVKSTYVETYEQGWRHISRPPQNLFHFPGILSVLGNFAVPGISKSA